MSVRRCNWCDDAYCTFCDGDEKFCSEYCEEKFNQLKQGKVFQVGNTFE